jgi:hypothetical protein
MSSSLVGPRSGVIQRIRSNEFKAFGSRPGRLVVSWPMLPADVAERFASCVQGQYDPYVRAAASALKGHGITDPIISVGWEANGHYPWSLGRYSSQVNGVSAL